METTLTESARSEARRRAILDVAREVFLAEGYAAASMSAIAARLGGSKGTLYNYFRSKEELFAAFMVDSCGASVLFDEMPPIGGDVRGELIDLGATLLGFLLAEPALSANRIVIAESARFPELGRIFHETGPKRGEAVLAEQFRLRIDAGQIKPGDPNEIGRWFKSMILADRVFHRLWGAENLTPAEIRAHVTRAVDIFLAAFGATKSSPD